MSPAGITDWRIYGTDIHRDMGCKRRICMSVVTPCLWPCQPRMQNFYRCCCLKRLVLRRFWKTKRDFDTDNIKRAQDESKLIIIKMYGYLKCFLV